MDLSWKAFSQACRISKALGYYAVDETPTERSNHSEQPHLTAPTPAPGATSESDRHKAEVDKNRKRFEFWHILRVDCLFRLSFGKPTLMPAGSWKVNFPDPTINGVDDESSRFIQIHFIASMRLALIVMKYLDWIDCGTDPNPISHDATIDSFINEVQSILSDWDTVGFLFHPPSLTFPSQKITQMTRAIFVSLINPLSIGTGGPPPKGHKPRRHLVLRRHPIQQL